MFFVLGLLAAGLVALLVTPVLWRRAMRLSRLSAERAMPSTKAEIDAARDLLRARFAVANRRLEVAVGRLNEKLAARLIESGRQRDEIGALTRQVGELSAAGASAAERIADLGTRLAASEHRLTAATSEVALRDERIASRNAEIAGLKTSLAGHEQVGEEQRLELVVRNTTIGNLNDRLRDAAAEIAAGLAARDRLTAELAAERARLGGEIGALTARLADAGERISGLTAARTVLEAERAERAAELVRRGEEIRALEAALAVAGAAAGTRPARPLSAELAAAAAELAQLRARLSSQEAELQRLRGENADLRRVAGAEWESDREESQRLRERLNEIAGNVVRLTQAMATREPRPANGEAAANGARPATIEANGEGARAPADGRTLGERLRALQQPAAAGGTRH
jgi:chromosome segregation ATPase